MHISTSTFASGLVACVGRTSLSSLFSWESKINDFMCLEAAVKIKDIESSYWYLDEEEHSQN